MKLNLSLSHKPIDSIMACGKSTIAIIAESGIPEVQSSKPYLNFVGAYNRMEAGYMKARKNLYTQTLMELDTTRDDLYRSSKRVVEGLAFSENAEEVEAAKLLLRLFDQYGSDILYQSYLKESARMGSFLESLKKPEYAAALVILRLEAKVAKLEAIQLKFEQTYQMSIEDKSSRNAFDSASAERSGFEAAHRQLMSYVEIKLLDGDPQWEALASKIVAFNTTFEQRETQRAAKDEEQEGSANRTTPQA